GCLAPLARGHRRAPGPGRAAGPDLALAARRGRAARRRARSGWSGARHSAPGGPNSRGGGGGRRHSRPGTPPAPPQAARTLSPWAAAPVGTSRLPTRKPGFGFAAHTRPHARSLPSPVYGEGRPPKRSGGGRGGGRCEARASRQNKDPHPNPSPRRFAPGEGSRPSSRPLTSILREVVAPAPDAYV